MSALRGSVLALVAAALMAFAAGCGGDDDSGGGGGSGGGDGGGTPRVVTDGSELECPFDASQVTDVVGVDMRDTSPVDATFGGSATCQFAGSSDGGPASVSFGPVGATELGPTKETYSTGGDSGGELKDRPEWGQDAFSWSAELAGSETAVGFFPTDDSGLVGVNVVVPGDGQVDATSALDELVEIVGPAGG